MQTRFSESIRHNCDCVLKQIGKFIEFSGDKAIAVNNADWLLDLNYIDLLRDVGICFSVNNMLRAECYKQRMERGLSFFEFNYMRSCSPMISCTSTTIAAAICSWAATASGAICWQAVRTEPSPRLSWPTA